MAILMMIRVSIRVSIQAKKRPVVTLGAWQVLPRRWKWTARRCSHWSRSQVVNSVILPYLIPFTVLWNAAAPNDSRRSRVAAQHDAGIVPAKAKAVG